MISQVFQPVVRYFHNYLSKLYLVHHQLEGVFAKFELLIICI